MNSLRADGAEAVGGLPGAAWPEPVWCLEMCDEGMGRLEPQRAS